MPATRSYGTWPSPLSAQTVAAQGLVRRTGSGLIEDVTPPPIDVRTRVHEYGGNWYVTHRGVLAFEGEQHGFRKAETVARCLEAELYFYGAVLGFTPADPVEPVQIHNLPGREVGA